MSDNVKVKLKKKEYNETLDSDNGIIVFDTVTKTIYVGGERYSSLVKSAVYDSTNKELTITNVDGSTIILNLADDTSANAPSSLLCKLRDDINQNKISIATLNGSDTGSVTKTVDDAINLLNADITTASESNDIVTIKTTIDETKGIISNDSSSSITLSKIAKTGSASDVSVTYNSSNTDVQTSISDIDSRITTLSTRQIQYIEPTSANTTPSGYSHYYASGSAYTGTLTASADTMNKIYLCKTTSYTGDYHQIMTVQSGSTYKWIDISTSSIDLSGYVKSITMNGKSYTPSTSGDVALSTIVNTIEGETEISGGETDYVAVTATSSVSEGTNTVSLVSSVKTYDIKTSTETNNGLATANNVKEYVNDNLTTIRTWTEEDIPSTTNNLTIDL